MPKIKPGHVVQGPRWPEPVELKLVEDLGDYVHLVGATTGSGEHVDQLIPHQELAELQIARVKTDFTASPREVFLGLEARRDPDHRSTWVGKHDVEADLTLSLGVAAYLVLSRYLAGWLGAALVLTILPLWTWYSHQLAWPFYALPYVMLILTALREVPFLGLLAVGYLAGTLAVSWSRFSQQHLPEFFGAIGSLHEGNGQQAPNNADNGYS